MDDNQTSKDGVKDQNGEGGKPDETLEIGEDKMTIDEAKELVKSGKDFASLREQYPDIDFTELPKAFTQNQQKLSDFERAQKEAEEKQNVTPLEPDEEDRRKDIDKFFSDPYVQEKMDSQATKKEQVLREDLKVEETLKALETELNGKDGRPKFDRVEVLEYGNKNQLYNPSVAYRDMYSKELDEWKLKKALEKKRPGTFSEKTGGEGSTVPDPKAPKTFKEATDAALAEAE